MVCGVYCAHYVSPARWLAQATPLSNEGPCCVLYTNPGEGFPCVHPIQVYVKNRAEDGLTLLGNTSAKDAVGEHVLPPVANSHFEYCIYLHFFYIFVVPYFACDSVCMYHNYGCCRSPFSWRRNVTALNHRLSSYHCPNGTLAVYRATHPPCKSFFFIVRSTSYHVTSSTNSTSIPCFALMA